MTKKISLKELSELWKSGADKKKVAEFMGVAEGYIPAAIYRLRNKYGDNHFPRRNFLGGRKNKYIEDLPKK